MSDILKVRKSWSQNNLTTEGNDFYQVNNVIYYIEKKAFNVRFISNNKIFTISNYYLNGSIIDKFMWYLANHKSKILLYHKSVDTNHEFKIRLVSNKINQYEKYFCKE